MATDYQLAAKIDAYYDRQETRWERGGDRPTVECAECGEFYAYEGEEHGPLCESCGTFESGFYADLSASSPALNVTADAGAQFVALEMIGDDGVRVTLRISVGDAEDLRDAINEASVMAAKEVA